jgi:hypothetical protein
MLFFLTTCKQKNSFDVQNLERLLCHSKTSKNKAPTRLLASGLFTLPICQAALQPNDLASDVSVVIYQMFICLSFYHLFGETTITVGHFKDVHACR